MVKAALFNSHANALFIALALMGCAHRARDLPPDMSRLAPEHRLHTGDRNSLEFVMPCSELMAVLAATRAELSDIETRLQRTQDENQSKGVAALLILTPIMLTMEDNKAMKDRYIELDSKREQLLRIAQARQCNK